jgi:hypothetical protein
MTLSTITKSWKAFAEHKWLILFAVVADIIFLIALNQLNYELLNRANDYYQSLTDMIGEQVTQLEGAGSAQELEVFASDKFAAAYNQLLKFIGLFTLAVLAVWLFCKGAVWFIAHKCAKEKPVEAKSFALKFFGMTIFWFIAFLLVGAVAMSIINYATTAPFPLISIKVANIISVFLLWVLAYFVFVSYSLVPHKVFRQTFELGIRQWKELLPAHVAGTIVVALSAIIPFFLVRVSPYLVLVFTVLVALPAIAWARVLWITAVHGVMKNG